MRIVDEYFMPRIRRENNYSMDKEEKLNGWGSNSLL